MATGTTTYETNIYRFTISYSYTNTSFAVTGVTAYTKQGGWAAWEQSPSLYIYVLKGSSPVPKEYQTEYSGAKAKQYITDRGGNYNLAVHSNEPNAFLSNTTGQSRTWSSDGFNNLSLSLSGSSVTLTIGTFIINTTGTLNNVVYASSTITLSLYSAPSGYSISITGRDTNSITVKHSWTNGSDSPTAYNITVNGTPKSVGNGSSATFTGLNSNTLYTASGSMSDGTTTLTGSAQSWTYPVLNTPSLSLASGEEHDKINVSVSPSVASSYDQFRFKIGSNSYGSYGTSKNASFASLNGNTTYTIYAQMKNTSSGYESKAVSTSITTWHDPISSLSVNLVNKWYWFLQIKSTVSYTGTITKYEFAIGDESWQNKGTSNSHSRGSINPGQSGNLEDDTNYTCQVRVTDNHGRTKTASATFKTMNDKALYINGELKELKVVKPDGSVKWITPNLLSIIKPDGTIINMNKIINNDDRTTYA